MPRVLLNDGFEFFFYSNERNEPMHIHVSKAGGIAKIWMEPEIHTGYFIGFNPAERRRILEIIENNQGIIKSKWDEYFKK